MAAGKKAQEDNYSGTRLVSHGVDDLPDDGDCEIDAKDLGPIQHIGHIEGTIYLAQPEEKQSLTIHAASLRTREKSSPASDALQSSTILIRSGWTNRKTRPLNLPTSTTSN